MELTCHSNIILSKYFPRSIRAVKWFKKPQPLESSPPTQDQQRAMAMTPWVLGLLGAAAHILQVALTLRIGAFNIQTFGDSKLSNETITDLIVSIVSPYDIILVQEVRDADLSAVKKLMDRLSRVSQDPYNYVVSKPLGRGTYKEQYLFIYREDKVSLVDSYYYDDGSESREEDTFSREPFIVKFTAPQIELGQLVLVPLHAAPNDAVAEIDALYNVVLDVMDRWGTEDMVILGDLNADCSYVRAEDWARIRLRSGDAFWWVIPDTADTTVTHTDCAYDRIVLAGSHLQGSVLPGTAKVDNFQKTYQLSYEDARAVSDHFPVEVTLRSTMRSAAHYGAQGPA